MATTLSDASTSERLADRLAAARRRRFTGRDRELALFRSALEAHEPPWIVLFIHGPGGVGKTALLDAFAHHAGEMGIVSTIIDGRTVDPSPAGFLLALRHAMGLDPSDDPCDAVPTERDSLLILDTYEQMTPLDSWLREEFLPGIPARARVVIAGRNPPASAWLTDNGWGDLVHVLPLRNLWPEESRAYLTNRGAPQHLHDGILAFTHGHPLALSLVADTLALGDSRGNVRPIDDPDVVRVLLERFVQGVPSQAHRQALEVCAHAQVTTEALLAEVSGLDDAPRLFDWLRGMSFIEHGPRGLFPHDLARDVLDMDLRWRNPDHYRELHRQVRAHVVRRIKDTQGIDRQWAFFDLLFLHRNSPVMQPFFDWSTLGGAYSEPATPDDYPVIIEMVLRHEGEESAEIARYWIERQPGAFTVFRETCGEIIGFVTSLAAHETTAEDEEFDPAIRAAHDFARRYAPVRPGEAMLHHRFAMGRDTYQTPSPAWDMVVMNTTVQWLTTPHLSWSFVIFANPDFAAPLMNYVNFQQSPDAEFVVGGRHYGVFTHDWRSEPAVAWLDLMEERELALDLTPEQLKTAHPPPLVVLSQPEFADAVRQALRDYTRPEALATSPLLRSRLVLEQADGCAPREALQALLLAAIEGLRPNPRDERLYRALHRTYLAPAATQELAAEALGLPFSTYRYHLTAGIERVVSHLWQRELFGAGPDRPTDP